MQRELRAARKALKKSLKELDSAEADRSHLQRQVNKLSRTLQVSSSWYNFLVNFLGTTSWYQSLVLLLNMSPWYNFLLQAPEACRLQSQHQLCTMTQHVLAAATSLQCAPPKPGG